MDCKGFWKLCGALSYTDDGTAFLSADELISEAEAEGDKSRVRSLCAVMDINADGHIYLKTPMPEGLSEDEINAARESGVIIFDDGTYAMELLDWKEENGKLFLRKYPESAGEPFSPWMEMVTDEDGYLFIFTSKYERYKYEI